MNRRLRERINVSHNGTDNSLQVLGRFDSINSDQLTQFSCLLTSFRNEIFQRLDENNRQMRYFMTETKQEIFKKINKSGKDYKWSHNKLKNDIIKNIDNLKIFADKSGFLRTDTSEDYFNEETKSNIIDDISVKSEPSISVNYRDGICSGPKSDCTLNEDDFFNDEDLSLPNESLHILEAKQDRKRDNRYAPFKILSVVADKVDTLCKRLSLVSDIPSITDTNEKLVSNNADEAASLEIKQKDNSVECQDNKNTEDIVVEIGAAENIVNDVSEKTVECSNLKTKKMLETYNEREDISRIHQDKNNKESMVKTGAIKKILNDTPGKDLEVAASVTQEMDNEEMEEVVGKLANVLDVKYDRQNVHIVCRQRSIVIKFRNEEEFKKWRGAARQIVAKTMLTPAEKQRGYREARQRA